ncbi:MAG TPA: hypothetical protein VHQ65_07155 [Thermoanaerobaculia bacterium]|nr:hypothetical protein [Thermoanaerobaculia bacterium]
MRHLRSLAVLVVLTLLAALPVAGQTTFPAAGLDVVDHTLRVAIHQVATDGTKTPLETLTFRGRLLLERSDPYINADNRQHIDFQVKSWEANAYSSKLGTLVTYRLNPAVQQKLGSIEAQQVGSAFPATFTFKLTFDAIAYGSTFVEAFEGEPILENFLEVPPSGNRRTSPTVTRFESHRVMMQHPELGTLEFTPLDCEDESGDVLQTFAAGEGERTLKGGAAS